MVLYLCYLWVQVSVVLENGQCYAGDLLIGADGIWSKVSFYVIFIVCTWWILVHSSTVFFCVGPEEFIWATGSHLFWLHLLYWYCRFCSGWYWECWVCLLSVSALHFYSSFILICSCIMLMLRHTYNFYFEGIECF